MPVFNREEFIAEAIQSILSQTHKNFELIIIDDGSTDDTLRVISRFSDKRIILLKNGENKGVSASRNKGIEKAEGNFIAFMDSDDISMPQRFEKQLNILQQNENIIICGSWLKLLTSEKIIRHRERHKDIIARLLLSCPLSLGSVMLKTFVLNEERFNSNLKYGEDYDFWSRVCWLGEMYNIQEPLLLYRTHKNQLSGCHKQQQLKMDTNIRLSLFNKLSYSVKDFPDRLIKKFFLFDQYVSISEFANFLKWLRHIKTQNDIQEVFPIEEFDKVIEEIRKGLIFKIYFKKSSIGLTKTWRIKSLKYLRKREVLKIVAKKIPSQLKIK
jgi:glycosyltransferase involved in cell wall biosynthesis